MIVRLVVAHRSRPPRPEEVTVLSNFTPHTTIAVADLERAKAWYAEKLDLRPETEESGGAWYECGGANFLLFPTAFAGTAENTVMEWSVEGIQDVMASLRGRGVTFERYEMEGVDWEGDMAVMGPFRGCWFKDSEGNVLALTEVVTE
jgi:catechol 2,3-dioxygenase-like lactoylglutathione lyase family enzyme